MTAASPPYAFVTLVTTDHYLPGALVVAAALRDLHPTPPTSPEELDPSQFHIICLVTPETVNVQTLKLLRRAFDIVIGVEVIEEDTEDALKLLGRPDLGTVLTKLHIFRLKSYRKIIYLDADVLPLLPLSHLFHTTSSFAAVPDVGWPDIFNSGVLVFAPGEDDFKDIMELVRSEGSWDGGDQGVLNEWRGKEWEHLSFTYNTTPTAAYTYAPAYKRFGSDIKAIHFIGPNKPWSEVAFRAPGSSPQSTTPNASDCLETPETQPSYAYSALLDRWFAVYDKHYRLTTPVFTTTGALMPTSVFREKTYQNAWDLETQATLDKDATIRPMGLDKLRQLALEGLGQIPTREAGEGAYMTLPLEGRIDLMASPRSHFRKFLPLKIQASGSVPSPATVARAQRTLSNTSVDSSTSHEVSTPVDEAFSSLTLSNGNAEKSPATAVPDSARWDPWSGTYPNMWDLIPGIQRYVSGQRAVHDTNKVRPQENVSDELVYRSWDENIESTSRDGDDEAEDEEGVAERI